MGGPSAEREVSLVTGKAVCESLNKRKYDILPIEISEAGNFYNVLGQSRIDLAFVALHGTYGEDGAIQGMLECLDIPYTGSRILASAMAMNKIKAAEIYKANNLKTPNFIAFTIAEWKKNKQNLLKQIAREIFYPVVIKPVNQGSAVGVSIIKNEADLIKAVVKTLMKFNWLIAQKFIAGKEATCGVLEKNGKAFALPPTRIVANFGEFYDYDSKYKSGGSTHICPADFKPAINKMIQELAVRAHEALGCRGMSRSDFFVTPKNEVYIIEINTIPGMTPTSLLPEAAKKAGISFSEMLDLIIKASV